jgi:hypothetical protein
MEIISKSAQKEVKMFKKQGLAKVKANKKKSVLYT